jgi:major membrane immunogen (membrane-anchored lipoprotein)
MKKRLFTFIIISTTLLWACSNSDSVTLEFDAYLKTVIKNKPKNGDIYLLVPASQCKNCIFLNGNKISEALNNRLHIISSLPQSHFKNFSHYHHDKEDILQELKFLDYENKLVFYNNDKVDRILKANINKSLTEIKVCEPTK